MHDALKPPKPPSRRAQAAAARRQGKFYTPDWLALDILDGCLRAPGTPNRPRILDPSCGEGAFLLNAFDRLNQSESFAPASDANSGSPPSEGGAGGVGWSGSDVTSSGYCRPFPPSFPRSA